MKNKKNLFKIFSAAAVTGVVALGLFNPLNVQANNNNFAIGEEFKNSQLDMGEKAYVIDYKSIDVTGDTVKDDVILVGTKLEKEAIFADNLTIVVRDGKTKKYSQATAEAFSGYEGKLWAEGDFDGDKVKDVMVTAGTGGSGGIYNHLIATFKDNKPQVIFADQENNGIEVEGKYIDGFKAQLNLKNLDKEILVDLSANKAAYINDGIYSKDGKVLKEVICYSYPFSMLEARDVDLDGIYELYGYQSVPGTCNADRISDLETIWKYDKNEWQVKKMSYSTLVVNE